MANIKIELNGPIFDGQPLSFKAPCNCTAVTGINVVSLDGEKTVSNVFTFTDAHGNTLTGIGNLFAAGAMVRVILDTSAKKAYIQNADTNAYLEAQLASKAPAGYGLGEWNTREADHADADYIWETGWFNAEANTPDNTRWVIHAIADAPNYEIQIAYKDGLVARREYVDSAWTPWEYENPPMIPGVAYRTTERYKGYPVYTVCVDFGQITSSNPYCNMKVPNASFYYPNFTLVDMSAIFLDAESTKEKGGYYDASQYFEYIWVDCASDGPLIIGAKKNDNYHYYGTWLKLKVTLKFVYADLDSYYANA